MSVNANIQQALRKIPVLHVIFWCENLDNSGQTGRTVRFLKLSIAGNQVELRYFMQCKIIYQNTIDVNDHCLISKSRNKNDI